MVAPLMEDSTVCYDGSHFSEEEDLINVQEGHMN